MATTISELLGIDETQIIPGTTPKLEIAIDKLLLPLLLFVLMSCRMIK